jgi:gamma-glutamyltranspeptidase/glutathione hydrolase
LWKRLEAVREESDLTEVKEWLAERRAESGVQPKDIAAAQHISALDEHGLAVSLTTTINTSFGSRVVAPASGILLNNEMDDFVARPGVPNHYGLVGSAANAVAPGARPLSSMSPTVLISPDGSERIVVGASGGPFIISSTLQVIINIVDFGMDPAEAVSAPRMHHQWAPDILFVDEGTSPDSIARLRALGHTVQIKSFYSSVQVIRGGARGFLGASDPRKGGWPAGVDR